jgi:hypothetical protein
VQLITIVLVIPMTRVATRVIATTSLMTTSLMISHLATLGMHACMHGLDRSSQIDL